MKGTQVIVVAHTAVLWAGIAIPETFKKIGTRNDLSYGVYIYGFPVQQLLVLVGAAKLGVGLYICASVLVTLPLAALSWFAVERPAQRWRYAFDRFPLIRQDGRIVLRSALSTT